MSSPTEELSQRGLNARQAATVERLLDAASTLLERDSYDDLTVRIVASHAGVSPATAYTYFSSKEHLFSALFWRHLSRSEQPDAPEDTTERLQVTVRHLAEVIGSAPALAAAATKALLSTDAEVERIRMRVGRHWYVLFAEALGPDIDPSVARTLTVMLSGALLEWGVGALEPESLAALLDTSVAVIVRGNL